VQADTLSEELHATSVTRLKYAEFGMTPPKERQQTQLHYCRLRRQVENQ
jgi:hypothetical protein